MSRAVFLDRDGTINQIVYFPELGVLDSPLNPDQFRLLPGAAGAIRALNRLGLKVIVVSNQPAIAKGKMTKRLFEGIRMKMKSELERQGARLDGEYYCFHHPDAEKPEYRVECSCRKPKPGMLVKAAEDFGLGLRSCYMIGDSLFDVEAGRTAGCITILIGGGRCDACRIMDETGVRPDYIARDLLHASDMIEKGGV